MCLGLLLFLCGIGSNKPLIRNSGVYALLLGGLLTPLVVISACKLLPDLKKNMNNAESITENTESIKENNSHKNVSAIEALFEHQILTYQMLAFSIVLSCLCFLALWTKTYHFGLCILISIAALLSILFAYAAKNDNYHGHYSIIEGN